MTEQIKSAIETFGDYKENGYDLRASNGELFDIAIRSLQAWSEVLQELEELKKTAEKMSNYILYKACEMAIDIINKHLAEIEKVR